MMRTLQQRRRTPGSRRKSGGQSMVEYLLLASIAIAVLAVPIDGKRSVVELMLSSIQTAYAKFLSAVAIPQ